LRSAGEEERMACELLDEGRLTRCRAVDGLIIPSLHERERYCWNDEDRDSCPTYRLFAVHRRPISEDAYYAQWMGLTGADEPARAVVEPKLPWPV
jgi:hypothetical protein